MPTPIVSIIIPVYNRPVLVLVAEAGRARKRAGEDERTRKSRK
jgi:hypothetical protein